MLNDIEAIEQLLAPSVEQLGFILYGCELAGGEHDKLLRLYIDIEGENSVSAEDCERVGKQVGAVLDVEEPIKGGCALEVSSPGMDRPLMKQWHYERVVGQKISIRLQVPIEERRRYDGKLLRLDEHQCVLEVEGSEVELPFSHIRKARVIPDLTGYMKMH